MSTLFTVTEEDLESGLRGIPVGYCVTSRIEPDKGLFYGTRPVHEIVDWSPERVIYLLLHGMQGKEGEIELFSRDLKHRSTLQAKTMSAITSLPREGHPMALFSAAILMAYTFEGKGDYHEDCLNLIAKIPLIAAAVINHHAGWGHTPAPDMDLGYMENFVAMLNTSISEDFPQVMRLFNVLHYDHGGGNLSAFVGKAVASGLEDLYGSIAAAMSALAGPRHGRANQEVLHYVESMIDTLGEEASEADVEQYIRDKLAKKELLYGFGHAVLRIEDPRATVLYQMAEESYSDHPIVRFALMIRKMGTKVLQENPKISNPYPNVDAISGILLTAAGFSHPEYYTLLFGVARTVGIAIQILYERCEARGGKGTPIVRPKYIYKARNP